MLKFWKSLMKRSCRIFKKTFYVKKKYFKLMHSSGKQHSTIEKHIEMQNFVPNYQMYILGLRLRNQVSYNLNIFYRRICATSYVHHYHRIQHAQHRKISRTNHNQTGIQILGLSENISVFSRLSPEVIYQL